jgi:hypothetical protein
VQFAAAQFHLNVKLIEKVEVFDAGKFEISGHCRGTNRQIAPERPIS